MVLAVAYSISIKQSPFFVWDGYLYPVKWLLLSSAAMIFFLGLRHYSMSHLFGFAQMKEDVDHNLINKTGTLDNSGILGMIRHPFYSALFAFLWACDLDVTRLIVNGILSAYIIIGTMLEEKKLIIEFGDSYREYQNKVSMLFPYKWLRDKIFTFQQTY